MVLSLNYETKEGNESAPLQQIRARRGRGQGRCFISGAVAVLESGCSPRVIRFHSPFLLQRQMQCRKCSVVDSKGAGPRVAQHPHSGFLEQGCFCCLGPQPWETRLSQGILTLGSSAPQGAPEDTHPVSALHTRGQCEPEPRSLPVWAPVPAARARSLPSWNLSFLICEMEIIAGRHRKYLALGLAHRKCSI